ncbi:MAG: putative membrane protein [Gammaproteobacteria bacterium]|jgi:uncharacterized membrane protein
MYDFHLLDVAACVFLFTAWPLYTWFSDYSRWAVKSLPHTVNQLREQWMLRMLGRDARMMDLLIQGNLVRGIAFFASTSILLVGGILAALGASDQATTTLSHIPFAPQTGYAPVEYKLLVLLMVFIYAFVKFVWAFRLANYCSILIGAAPELTTESSERTEYAAYAGRISSITGRHFNQGLRANIFAIAVLGWFFHPVAFLLITIWALGLLYRREFRSGSLDALRKIRSIHGCEMGANRVASDAVDPPAVPGAH